MVAFSGATLGVGLAPPDFLSSSVLPDDVQEPDSSGEGRRDELDLQIFAPVEEAEADPIERVFGVLGFYREFLESTQCGMGCPIGNLALELADSHLVVRQKLAQLFDSWCGRVRGYLEDARNQLPRDVDLDAPAQFVLTVMEGGLMQARAARSLGPFDAGVAHLRRYFEALRASAGSQAGSN